MFRRETVVVAALVAVLAALAANHLAGAYELGAGSLTYAMSHLADAFDPSWDRFRLVYTQPAALSAALLAALVGGAVVLGSAVDGNYRRGEEHGSARFATLKEMREFGNWDVPVDNMILSRDVMLRYHRRDFTHERNKNVIVVGGSGSGKTRGFIKPNLMQLAFGESGALCKPPLDEAGVRKYARSFVLTDPKGSTRGDVGYLFARAGYGQRELNVVDWWASHHYNPFRYITTEAEALTFVTCFIKNTTPPDGGHGGDPFWESSEKNFLYAVVSYMRRELPPEERTLNNMCKLIDLAKVDEADPAALDGLDVLFREVEVGERWDPDAAAVRAATQAATSLTGTGGARPSHREEAVGGEWADDPTREADPYCPCVASYRNYRVGAPATRQSVLTTVKVRLAPLRVPEVMRVLEYDEMDLDRFGDERMILYLVPHDQDETYNFLIAILVWQMLNVLSKRADNRYHGSLPTAVSFLLDEAANFYIPSLDQVIATCRSRNIGVTVVLQSLTQLQTRYDESKSKTIVACCDSMVFLGGNDADTPKQLEETIGQQTVTTDNTSQSKQASGNSLSTSIQQHGRALMQASEIRNMKRDDCLVILASTHPWLGRKYDVAKHPMYKYIDPGHEGCLVPSTPFSMEAYSVNRRYYENPTSLSVSCDIVVEAGPARSATAPGGPKTLSVEWRVRVGCAGAAPAYALTVEAEPRAESADTVQAAQEGRPSPFPDVAGRAAGGLDVSAWSLAEWRAPKGAKGSSCDDMAWVARSRVDRLEAGGEALHTLALEIDLDELLPRIKRRQTAQGDPPGASFDLELEVSAAAANAEAARARSAVHVTVYGDGRRTWFETARMGAPGALPQGRGSSQ